MISSCETSQEKKFFLCKISSSISSSSYESQHLILKNFKVYACNRKQVHSIQKCIYYHTMQDKRRESHLYNSKLCENIAECPFKEKCSKCHNKIEFLYHPDNYKTIFCKSFYVKGKCKLKEFCPFAHNDNEVQLELLHHLERDSDLYMFGFKTVICPYIWKKHDFSLCVYAHEAKELRRKPHSVEYSPKLCDSYSKEQKEDCPFGMKCEFAHNNNETNYHPLNYKSMVCKDPSCKNQEICPFVHNKNDFEFSFFWPILFIFFFQIGLNQKKSSMEFSFCTQKIGYLRSKVFGYYYKDNKF